MIEENNGIKNVNLREIAKKVGCAHTNLYNYFGSLDEIFWESLAKALILMIEFVETKFINKKESEDRFFSMISGIIGFSTLHTGWYKLIWIESINGYHSPEVDLILTKPSQIFNTELMKANDNQLSIEQAQKISNILHSYLHGELCMWIHNRSSIDDIKDFQNCLLKNMESLYQILIKN
jgi:AcrR family transcriptional regulator